MNRLAYELISVDFDIFLVLSGLPKSQARRWYSSVLKGMHEFSIFSDYEVNTFFNRLKDDSRKFTVLEESFDYSPAELKTFIEAGQLTAVQAEMLGRRADEGHLPAERQRAIANLVYKNTSGNSAPDHGWKFRGRGLLFLRGQRNYYLCGKALNLDLIAQPDLVCEPLVASRAAAWVFRNIL